MALSSAQPSVSRYKTLGYNGPVMITLPHASAEAAAIALFILTYVGMALGRLPGLKIDRAGIALLATVGLIALSLLEGETLRGVADLPTLAILFGLMIVSAQFGLAGFYDWCTARIANANRSPAALLALTVIIPGLLSAVLANDVVVFAVTPLLCQGLVRRGLDPRPFLIALAGATNAGSAATVIGNPQNILIGQVGNLEFWDFLGVCGPPALFGLFVVYAVTWLVWRRALASPPASVRQSPLPPLDRLQLIKATAATLAVVILLSTDLPHEISVLTVAALLLVSRRFQTRTVLSQVDWPLILLFGCLFAVNAVFRDTGIPAQGMAWLGTHGLLPDHLSVMAPLALATSNTIGNVPAVIMLLSLWHGTDGAFYALALLSTLAGNLLLVGSLANIIVAERAASVGVRLPFIDHARCGIPMTLVSMAGAVAWLAGGGWLPW